MATGLRVTFMPAGTMLGAVGTFRCTVCGAGYETDTPTAMVITDYPAGSYSICNACIDDSDDVLLTVVNMLKRVIGDRLPVH